MKLITFLVSVKINESVLDDDLSFGKYRHASSYIQSQYNVAFGDLKYLITKVGLQKSFYWLVDSD